MGGQSLEYGVDLLGDGRQHELELLLGSYHSGSLVSQVFQGGGDIDLLRSLRHSTEDHVDEAIGSGSAGAVAAVHHDRAGSAPV